MGDDKTARDGIDERMQLVRVLLKEISAIAEASDVPVENLLAELTELERERLGVRKSLTNREKYTLQQFWESSTADCYTSHGNYPRDPEDAAAWGDDDDAERDA